MVLVIVFGGEEMRGKLGKCLLVRDVDGVGSCLDILRGWAFLIADGGLRIDILGG